MMEEEKRMLEEMLYIKQLEEKIRIEEAKLSNKLQEQKE